MRALFKDRRQAGLKLSEKIKLTDEEKRNSVLIALPRGGVEVAVEVSKALRLPLDVLIVRKVGHPLYSEYGIGAVTEDDFSWLDQEALGVEKIPQASLDEIFEHEKKEVARRKLLYRQNRSLVDVENKNVILIDDGLATGVTSRLAARYLRFKDAKKVILAVPVCVGQSAHLRHEFDEVICLTESSQFTSVGQFFKSFDQLADEEVQDLLAEVYEHHPLPAYDLRQFPPVEQLVLKNAVALKTHFDFAKMIEKIKNSKIVMLGESSHGNQEFYEWRRLISQELIENHGFQFIAVEGDWPACTSVHQYIQSKEKYDQVYEAFQGFHRWPTWMWGNTETVKLAQNLKKFNELKSPRNQVGFYGLDVYSFFDSVDEVLRSLHEIDPALEKQARQHYACLEPFKRNEKTYAQSLHHIPEGCSKQIADVLQSVLQLKLQKGYAQQLFDIQQNARIVKNAEYYYSSLIHGTEESWNIRDRHMMETLDLLLKKHGPASKAIVWAHNTHIGDDRATLMRRSGFVNLGGLARAEWGENRVCLLGFGTYRGDVTAARAWDGPAEALVVPPAGTDSIEYLFHRVAGALETNSFFLWVKDELKKSELKKARPHRALGVVYNPQSSRHENNVMTSLTDRYDGFVFVDQTHALVPLKQKFQRKDIPETWPGGF